MLTQALIKIETSGQFKREILVPDYTDYQKNPASLRHAFHLAQSLFHLRDWTFNEFSTSGSWQYGRTSVEYQDHLIARCPSFAVVRDIANASKHLILTQRPSTGMTHVANTFVRQITSGFPMFLSKDSYLGGTGVVAHIDNNKFVEFKEASNHVLEMWDQIFVENSWK